VHPSEAMLKSVRARIDARIARIDQAERYRSLPAVGRGGQRMALPGAPFDPARLSAVVSDPAARAELALALQRSDPEAIRNYYRANLSSSRIEAVVAVQAPTLILYGDQDRFIPARYYKLSAEHVAGSCEIRQIPGGGHFLHAESAAQVTSELESWLRQHANS